MSRSRAKTTFTNKQQTDAPVWETDLFLQMQRIRCALPQYDWQPEMPDKALESESSNKTPEVKPKRKRSFEIKLSKYPAKARANQFKSVKRKPRFFAPRQHAKRYDPHAKVELATPTPNLSKRCSKQNPSVKFTSPAWKSDWQAQNNHQVDARQFPELARTRSAPVATECHKSYADVARNSRGLKA